MSTASAPLRGRAAAGGVRPPGRPYAGPVEAVAGFCLACAEA
ncbi:hypothetical protein [Streptomyces longisporus]